MLCGFSGDLSLLQVLGQGAWGQNWEKRQGERGDPHCRHEPPPALRWRRLKCKPGLGATAYHRAAPSPRGGFLTWALPPAGPLYPCPAP